MARGGIAESTCDPMFEGSNLTAADSDRNCGEKDK